MKLKNNSNTLLNTSPKSSLLLAAGVGIPLGYVLLVISLFVTIAALFHPAIEQPPFPVTLLMLLCLPTTLVCLAFMHRAVYHELKNRKNEPSHLKGMLRRMLLFIGFWLILFFVILLGLDVLTSIAPIDALEISAIASVILTILCGAFLSRKELASSSNCARKRKT